MQVIVKPKQTALDVALQVYGSIEGIRGILIQNDVPIDEIPLGGSLYLDETPIDKRTQKALSIINIASL